MSLMPEYYKEKWSLMVGLAAPVTNNDITSAIEVFMTRGKNA